jgi:hypothetical protein
LFGIPGKLTLYRTGYKFCDKGYTNPNGVFMGSSLDDNGKAISLTGKGCHVLCPKPPDGNLDRPKTRGRYWVKNSECLKCQFRLKGRICAIEAKADREAFLKVAQVAVEETNKFMNGETP